MSKLIKLFVIISLLALVSCAPKGELGSKNNPIKMYFVPSLEAGKVVMGANEIAKQLNKRTGYYFDVAVPTSYAAVIEAMGAEEADIAWFATFAYIIAHSKYDAQVELTTVRNGLSKYRGQFVARTDSDINSIEDIQGKVIAYTDNASTSGYMYPAAILKMKGIEPGKSFISGSHTASILAVYEGKADVGCSYWSPEKDGVPQDARKSVLETVPDIMEKEKIIGFTDWIPNDTVTFRKDFPKEMKDAIVSALLDFPNDEKARKSIQDLYDIDGFVKASDADYDVVRETLKSLNADASEYLD